MIDKVLPLPVYARPPISEVAYGVVFVTLKKFLAPHFGMLWDLYKDNYTSCREVAPIVAQIEGTAGPGIEFEFVDIPPLPRVWFLDAGENKIIQVQRERFHHNWRKIKPDDRYPKHEQVSHEFRERLTTFDRFITDNGLGNIELRQCELTYVNHIQLDEGLDMYRNVEKIFPNFNARTDGERFQQRPDSFQWRTSYPLPNETGKLHVTIQLAKPAPTDLPILLFDLTARGIEKGGQMASMDGWFDMAHYQIVQTFANLVDAEFQRASWGRER